MGTGYRWLGVDLGTTFTAAAMARGGSYEMVRLGSGRYEIPSTVCLAANGRVQVGENAEQLAEQYPAGVAPDVKRRIGTRYPST
jgi:molecular chaperone DnaK (HSP70)